MTTLKILCLHRITDNHHPSWPGMPIKTFEKLLKYISKHYQLCLPSNIQRETKKQQMIVTFDDGFEDFYINALPLLKKYKIPSVLNVVVKCITDDYQIWTQRLNDILDIYAKHKRTIVVNVNGNSFSYNINPKNAENIALALFKLLLNHTEIEIENVLHELERNAPAIFTKSKMMSLEQIKDACSNGVIIGSHGMTHKNLASKFINSDTLNYEIIQSKKVLENLLSTQIEYFAFPNGLYKEECIRIAKKANYLYLFIVNNKPATFDNTKNTVLLDRIQIYSSKHWKNILRLHNFHNPIRLLKDDVLRI